MQRESDSDGHPSEPEVNDSGPTSFSVDTLEEIRQLGAVDWFPVRERNRTKDAAPENSAGQSAGRDVSMVATAKSLGALALRGDQDALLRLVIMASAAQLELWKLQKELPVLGRASEHSIGWFSFRSPLPRLGGLLREIDQLARVAVVVLKFRRLKGNLNVPANACAYKLVSYMVLAKRGLISNPRFAGWSQACQQLDPLSEQTAGEWWELGTEIAKDMFPDLDILLFGDKADAKDKDRSYSAAIHHLGLAFKDVWPMFKGIEDAKP